MQQGEHYSDLVVVSGQEGHQDSLHFPEQMGSGPNPPALEKSYPGGELQKHPHTLGRSQKISGS